MKNTLLLLAIWSYSAIAMAQNGQNIGQNPVKIKHAEPLFIDLIRDLGALKGEREWNVGMALVDQLNWDKYETLVEYEWAPRDRLGLEVEIPVTFYAPVTRNLEATRPSNQIESLKLAAQWSFFVSSRTNSSMALGYLNELNTNDFEKSQSAFWFTGNTFNPFLVAAKRWGSQFHSLLYTGPRFKLDFTSSDWSMRYAVHTSFHYMVPGSRNFVGLEVNKFWGSADFDMTIRPQMRLAISEQLMMGIVTGIPIRRENERFSTFLRLIYEPKHGH